MKKKRLFSMQILLVLAMVLAMLTLTPVPAFAAAATATRTLPDAAVGVGAQFEVGIDADGFGAFGQVVETLPSGFSYVAGSATAVSGIAEDTVAEVVDGQDVTFTFLCESPISFTYDVTAPDTSGTFLFAGVLNGATADVDPIGGDTEVNVGVIERVELEFTGSLAEDERDTLVVIPTGVTELDISLSATADLDLNLYDGDTFVIGWKAIISSSGPATGTYQGDTFTYSGWSGGEEYINSDGSLGRAYDLKVYGFEAGDYTVTVSYVPAAPTNPPPTITIVVPATVTLGSPVTVTVSATDPDGVTVPLSLAATSPTPWLTIYLPIPPDIQQPNYSQSIESLEVTSNLTPLEVAEFTDDYGNAYKAIKWETEPLDSDEVITSLETIISRDVGMNRVTTSDPYPIPEELVPNDVSLYLEPSIVAQSADPTIIEQAAALAADQDKEVEVVEKTVNWVNQNIEWKCSHDILEEYGFLWTDAVRTLKYRVGVCGNFSNLTIALLRAQGVPARFVNIFLGYEQSNPGYQSPVETSVGHTCIEAYYPQVGWVRYDPVHAPVYIPYGIPLTVSLDSASSQGVCNADEFTETHQAAAAGEGKVNYTYTVAVPVSVFDPTDYDADGDGVIEIGEVLNAISDYFAGEITITQVLEVIALYFAS